MISKDSGKVGLMTDYDFLVAFTTERRGKVLPELGKAEKGIEILSAFVTNRPDLSGDPDALDPDLRNPNHLANSMHGCVFVLLAHSLIVDGREEEALQYLLAWKPFEPPSFQERGVIRYRDRSLAEFYVSKKRWGEAEDVLKSLLVPDMEDASTYAGSLGEGWTIQQLAEIMIETGRYEAAGKLLFPAIATREAAGNDSRQDTVSLMLDLVACLLGQKALDVALTQLLKLRQTLKAKADSINNQSNSATSSQRMLTDLTYVWCLAARLSISLGDWNEAKSCWLKALEMAERVSYFNGSNHFVVFAIKVSLAHVYWTIGESPCRSVEDLELEVKATDLDNGRSINDVGISKEWVETLKSWRSGLGEDKIKT
ncbi:hypothetical protein UCRPA7_1146 [Phaeoacremonium minimum UCRPA7]|uniref:Uncharacterized protein n=1 Tax=Phaeoacremonium minimum (strain UCR-PA7) TaxID=1286976 RepID=R8BVH6_PHAM7|nr:hypothetical protein UCRPA7_1146 [Phaeoacremonium minimum UCRPA7]EOO03376.1 hypothetical protein UCRPA7_1146 [Phaeoacremonium minimum UCRPA7]